MKLLEARRWKRDDEQLSQVRAYLINAAGASGSNCDITKHVSYDESGQEQASYSISSDGSVRLVISGAIKYKFTKVAGDFEVHNIKTLINCPEYVGGSFDCGLSQITSLQHAPQHVGENFYCHSTPKLHSYHNIHKQIKFIGGKFSMSMGFQSSNQSPPSHLLVLLLIRGLRSIHIDGGRVDE